MRSLNDSTGARAAYLRESCGLDVYDTYQGRRLRGTYVALTGGMVSRSHCAMVVILASSCCCPMICTPTGIPCTAMMGMVTAGANNMELGK